MKINTMKNSKTLLLTVSALLSASSISSAALSAVFEYSFPASYSGGGPALTDLSGAGNHGTIDGAGTGGYLSTDRPAGFATGGSLTGSAGGHGATTAVDLLDNNLVAANGGFTMETWFRWDGTFTDVRKLIDYAGTESLRTANSEIQFNLSNGGTVLSHSIVGDQWYHVIGQFDSGSNTVDGAGALAGTAYLYVDGVLVDTSAATKTAQGDNLDRAIGINRWAAGGADWNQGAIFNPAVYLGVEPVPEPSSVALLGLGTFALILRRKK